MRPDLRSELLRRVERLQAARGEIGRDREAVSEVDAGNLAWLRSVVAEIGWPGRSMVGPDGADAAWLLAAVSLGSLAGHIASITARHGPPKPSVVPCAECGAAVEVWLPGPGDEQTIDCAACGWTVTLAVGAPPGT